jgi:hypothetical protein
MANTLTTVNDSKIMEMGIAALNHGLTKLSVFSLDVSAEIPANEYVYVPLATARAAATYGSDYQVGNTTVVGKSVQLSGHDKASWHVTEAEQAKTPTPIFEIAARECAYALPASNQNAVFNAITASNFGNTDNTDKEIVAAAAFDADAVLTLREICEGTNKWNFDGPNKPALVLTSAYISNLLKDPAVRDLSASGLSAGVSGKVGSWGGFDIYTNNVISGSTPGAGSENLVGFACLPQCLAVAVRPVPMRGTYEVEDVVVDPATGAAMTYRRWTDVQTGYMWGTYTAMYGVGVVDAAALVRIVSA